ncbi:MAG: peptide-methionine (S)-S-oxide reductase MsrA [Stagnimonas sp.]|nr:peptide-methionine (S)-S-oxide reductase MsrA [Stagnimonas sp.]
MRILITALVSLLPLLAEAASPPPKTEKAIVAGGCFWCTESDMEKIPGVISAVSGYIGGTVAKPTYEQVSSGRTGHTEAVEVTFDPTKISYAQLVEKFWPTIDPTVQNQQFCDHGPQYRSGIYPLNDAQMQVAEASKAALVKSARVPNVYTEIVRADTFWPAEAYHQDYYKTNSLKYKYYRYGCGRDARLEEIWGAAKK